jgi:nitroreductase/ferredoxin
MWQFFKPIHNAMQTIEQNFHRTPPVINTLKCTGCGLCIKVCPAEIFTLTDKKAVPSPTPCSFCIKCGHCVAICPVQAIIDPEYQVAQPARINREMLPSPDALLMLLRARRSTRAYRDESLPREVIESIIEAGRYTATGGNRQDVFYTVLDTRARIQELRKMVTPYLLKIFNLCENPLFLTCIYLTGNLELIAVPKTYAPVMRRFAQLAENGDDRIFYNAPAMILVHTRKMDQPAGFGCAAALYNCSLMAELQGLGCCFNGFVHVAANYNRRIKNWLGLPRNHQCHGAMTLGYPATRFSNLPERDPAKIDWR